MEDVVPHDFRLSIELLLNDNTPEDIVQYLCAQPLIRHVKHLGTRETVFEGHDLEYAEFEFVYNNPSSDVEHMMDNLITQDLDEAPGIWEGTYSKPVLLRKGVSAYVKTPDDNSGMRGLNLGAFKSMNGTLDAQLVYHAYLFEVRNNPKWRPVYSNELLGKTSKGKYVDWTYPVYKIRDDDDLVCRIVMHEGRPRWQPVGQLHEVLSTKPIVYVNKMLVPEARYGLPPYVYKFNLMLHKGEEDGVYTFLEKSRVPGKVQTEGSSSPRAHLITYPMTFTTRLGPVKAVKALRYGVEGDVFHIDNLTRVVPDTWNEWLGSMWSAYGV